MLSDLDFTQGAHMRRNLIDSISYHARLHVIDFDDSASTEVSNKFKH